MALLTGFAPGAGARANRPSIKHDQALQSAGPVAADRRMLEIAEKIIEQQEGKFDPSTFKDRYEDTVRDLIARKKKGQKVTTAAPVERGDGKVVDLMDVLRRSLTGQGRGSKEGAERLPERKKGKVVAMAKHKAKKSAA